MLESRSCRLTCILFSLLKAWKIGIQSTGVPGTSLEVSASDKNVCCPMYLVRTVLFLVKRSWRVAVGRSISLERIDKVDKGK